MFTENKTTELKREYVDDIKNTAIAFANCDGGTLYVGIEDDGTVGGGVLGIGGMLLAVPLTATLYQMLRADVVHRNAPASPAPSHPSEDGSEGPPA